MSTTPKSFALAVNANIQAAIAKRGADIPRIREQIGLSPAQFRARKQGRAAWTLNEIQAFSDAIGVDPAEITYVNIAEFEAIQKGAE